MADLNRTRQRLKEELSRLDLEHVVGVGGLAVFSAASAFALVHPTDPNFVASLHAAFGTLGLNVLASLLVQGYTSLIAQPTGNEQERLGHLARTLEPAIKRDAKLRSEIGAFLNETDAFDIAREIVEGNPTVHGWLLFKIYTDLVAYRNDFEQIQSSLDRILAAVERLQEAHLFLRPFILPPLPSIFLGRADVLDDLKARLGITSAGANRNLIKPLTVVRGWPGVGKTTLTTVLAYDPDIQALFPDGVLWASLGLKPNLLSELANWGRALGTDELLRAPTLEQAKAELAALLQNRRMLLIVDDAFDAADVFPFQVGGPRCGLLVTTRFPEVAELLDPTLQQIYLLRELNDQDGLELLGSIAQTVVKRYHAESLILVKELEGLPLALHVAGRLLNVEQKLAFSITNLIQDLKQGAKILQAKAPQDRTEIETQTLPTVAVLLQKSTDLLDPATRDYYAFLGAFAPKPATFDEAALQAVWLVQDPKPIVRKLVDRGLLEPVPPNRFQMHALLVMHAKSLLTD